jgi:uncharacterized repeat protein (TIGR01451 family)/fimbrial isopeptide formation D2 family protein
MLCAVAASLAVSPSARAEGTPGLALAVQAPTTVLYGEPATVTLQASNPFGQPYGYNLSYRAVLPAGISYRSGSGDAGGATLEPQVIANAPESGKTTLIWSNVQDLSPNSRASLSFEVEHSTSVFTVGGEYTIDAGAYIAEEPRYLPKFKGNAEPEGPGATSYTGYAQGSATTTISALEVTQEEPSPKNEILRGVHDHQVEYTVIVRNTGVNATDGAVVSEWLPAGLEYLGCSSTSDHTSDAPTNSPSDEEYPLSGSIEPISIAECQAASSVATVEGDPDGSGPDPNAVYTHVQWTLGELKAGETVKLQFIAAVPLRENTLTWTKGEPTTSGEAQAANLDNNSGLETRDGESLTTYATAAGDYAGTLPVSAENHLTRVAKDMIVEKAASTEALEAGQITHWTLTIRSSEYRYNAGIEVIDTLPNGLCPLGSENYTSKSQPSDSECESTHEAADEPSSKYAFVEENANGTWTLKWDEGTDPALKNLQANEVTTITFETRTRGHYQQGHADGTPVLADDSISNSVEADATTNVVCEGHSDCTTAGEELIDHERPASEPISDTASVKLTAAGPTISKRIARTSSTSCEGVEYTSEVPVYRPGDLICWQLMVQFPGKLYTQGYEVTDYLPLTAIFDPGFDGGTGEKTEPADTLPGTSFSDSEAGASPGGAVRWSLPEGGKVEEKKVFDRVIQTTATIGEGATPGELQGNLMKFANENTGTESFSERAEADFELQFPQLSLSKQITEVHGEEIAPTHEASVQGGDEAKFELTLTNSGGVEAQEAKVWELLPEHVGCGQVESISDGGVCSGEKITWGEAGLGEEAIAVEAEGTRTLSFVVTVPTTIGPGTALGDRAGVVDYTSETNTGGRFRYIPEGNVNPLIEIELGEKANVGPVEDDATLQVPDASVVKSHTSSIKTGSDGAEQATIGEVVNYVVSATVPAGTTLGGTAKLTDPGLPSKRLVLVPGTVEVFLDGGAASGFSTEEVSGSPVVLFPADYTVAAHGENAVVEMRFKAYVANVSENARGGSIPNTGKLTWTDPVSGGEEKWTSPANDVPIVEPNISLKESDNGGASVHGGQLVEYSLELKNASGASPAYGNKVLDTVPNGVTPVNAKGEPLLNGEATADGGVWSEGSRTITWELATLESNKAQTFHYQVKVDEEPVSGASFTDHAVATTSSLPGTTGASGTTTEELAHRRNAGEGYSGYEAKAEAKLTPSGPTIAKGSDSATATIGHRITYTLTVTLPAEVTSYDDTVIDTLPNTLDFDEYIGSECTSGCPPETAPTVQTYKPEVGEAGTTIAWYFGDLGSTSQARTVKLTYLASVRPTNRHSGATVESGQTIENSATVYYDKTKKLSFEAETIPSTSAFEGKAAATPTKTTAVEPKIALVKESSVDKGAYGTAAQSVTDGDTIAYRLKVTNEGTGTAYDVAVSDVVPSALTDVTIPSTDLEKGWAAGEPEIQWNIPVIAAGATVELEYEAKLVSAGELRQGEEATNVAQVSGYFGVAEAERAQKLESYAHEPITYRGYTGPTAQTKATVALPSLSIDKTAGASGYPKSANAEVGQPFTWRVVVENTSSVLAKNLTLTDAMPENWEYISGTASFSTGGSVEPTPTGTVASGLHLTWSTSIELAAGASTVLTYEARPTLAAESEPGTGTPNVNAASASVTDVAGSAGDAEGPFAAGPSEASANLVVPGLTITKTPSKPIVDAGEGDSYTITVGNSGVGVAREVKVLDTLPSGMTYESGSATASPSSGFSEVADKSTTVEWEIAEIESGKSVEITMPVAAEAGLAAGTTLTNAAAVHSAEETDPVQAEGTIETQTSADVVAAKKVLGASEAVPGEQLVYEVSATDDGPSVARAVKLVDELPEAVTYVSATGGCSLSAGVVTCQAGDLEPGETASFQIVVSVASDAIGTIVNAARAEGSTPDPNNANNEATVETPTKPSANLKLVKTALSAEVLDGQEATFSLLASNEGPSDAADAKIVDTLPAGLTYVRAEGASCTAVGSEVTCPLRGLALGATRTVTLVARTSGVGTDDNTATVSSATEDPDAANNSSEASVQVLPAADLVLEKTATPSEVQLPGEVTYALKVTNAGPDAAQGVVVTDRLPAGENYVSDDAGCNVSGQTVSCSLGELGNEATRTIQLIVKVGLSLGEQTVTNTAEVSSATDDPEMANDVASAPIQTGPAADVAIVKHGPASVITGEQIAWQMTVVDDGPSTAHDVTVLDPLPAGVSYDGSTTSQGSCSIESGTLTCELGTLADGASAQITVAATVAAGPGSLQNTAVVSAEEPDPEPANDSSTATTQIASAPSGPGPATSSPSGGATPTTKPSVKAAKHAKGAGAASEPPAKLALSVKLATPTIAPGQPLVYHLTLRNTSGGTAMRPEVCDQLPAQVSVVALHGGKLEKGKVCYELPKLAKGKRHVFTLVLRADSNARGSILDPARATAKGIKPLRAKVRRPVHGSVAPHVENAVTG